MPPIFHLLGEDVTGVAGTFNVLDFDGPVLDPFANGVVPKFHVTDGFSSEIVGPIDTRFVVIIYGGRFGSVDDRDASVAEVPC